MLYETLAIKPLLGRTKSVLVHAQGAALSHTDDSGA